MAYVSLSSERRAQIVEELLEALNATILKVNYHFHSGYENKDLRTPNSIFLNFFKKQVIVMSSQYLMRLKNRDFELRVSDKYVSGITFNDFAYESYPGMSETIALLNEATCTLNYSDLQSRTNTQDKFFQVTNKIIQGINDFKF